MVYAVSSLLEAPFTATPKFDDQKDLAILQKEQDQMNLNKLNNHLHENFWVAYDSLDPKKANTLLVKGIQMAKDMQLAVNRVGTSLIARKEIKIVTHFRYCILEND